VVHLVDTMVASSAPVPARLFYDPVCGPCTMFARVSEWASRSRLRAVPYDGPDASRELGDLDNETRFSYAHLVDGHGRRSGSAIMNPLVGLTLGATGERIVTRVGRFDRGLRWVYDWFWNYRRTRGCASPAHIGVS